MEEKIFKISLIMLIVFFVIFYAHNLNLRYTEARIVMNTDKILYEKSKKVRKETKYRKMFRMDEDEIHKNYGINPEDGIECIIYTSIFRTYVEELAIFYINGEGNSKEEKLIMEKIQNRLEYLKGRWDNESNKEYFCIRSAKIDKEDKFIIFSINKDRTEKLKANKEFGK